MDLVDTSRKNLLKRAQYGFCLSEVKTSELDEEKPNIREIKPEIKIYDGSHVEIKQRRVVLKEQPKHLQGVSRGKIKGFSHKSALRLRKSLAILHQPNLDPFSVTFTTQKKYTPDEWRDIMKRFRNNFAYYTSRFNKDQEPVLIWRIELQRRGTPHLHCLLWHLDYVNIFDDPSYWSNRMREQLLELWIKATREERNEHLERYSIHLESGLDARWQEYMISHNTKKKAEQLGWKGRQWGIFNRGALKEREYLKISADHDDSSLINDSWLKVYRRALRKAMKGRHHTPKGIKKLKGVNDAHINTGNLYTNFRLTRSIADLGDGVSVVVEPSEDLFNQTMLRKFEAIEASATPS